MMIKINFSLTLKAPNTILAKANTADPDEMAHNEPSHLDLVFAFLSLIFQHTTASIKSFLKFLQT